MFSEKFEIEGIPAVLLGSTTDRVYLFVHGQCGCKEEAIAFSKVACPKGWQVLSIDLPQHGERKAGVAELVPWQAIPELRLVMKYIKSRWRHIAVRANSIGAWLCMQSFEDETIEKALYVSPIIDMEGLICGMMKTAGVTPEQLEKEGEIEVANAPTLSWKYYMFAKENKLSLRNVPTCILYGGADNMTPHEAIEAFSKRFGCSLTVMEGGEHWFHTETQLASLENWTKENI